MKLQKQTPPKPISVISTIQQFPHLPNPQMDPVLQTFIAAAASFFFVSALFALTLLCRCRHRRSNNNQTLPLSHAVSADESAAFDPSLDRVSMSDLAAATKDFSPDRIVGDGGFGFVYKAILPSGIAVAVKRLSADAAFHGLREFHAEMETLGRLRHPNIARLLGYCAAGPDRVLIYEFLEGGSLDSRIHDPSSSPMTWQERLRVLRGAAAGLAFLHHECRPRIVHRDVKSSNVLMDLGFEARIADFGLARWVDPARSHVSTQVAGTMGYMPPEYREGATAATVRADVYSFGVVMVEAATGRRPNLPAGEGNEPMVRWARRMVEEGRGMEILDRRMGIEGLVVDEMVGFLQLANRCTEESSGKRPSMREVLAALNLL